MAGYRRTRVQTGAPSARLVQNRRFGGYGVTFLDIPLDRTVVDCLRFDLPAEVPKSAFSPWISSVGVHGTPEGVQRFLQPRLRKVDLSDDPKPGHIARVCLWDRYFRAYSFQN